MFYNIIGAISKGLAYATFSVLIMICLLGIIGCSIESMSTEKVGDAKVELLFVKDGISVYRFVDCGRFVYFTKNSTYYETGGKAPQTIQTIGAELK